MVDDGSNDFTGEYARSAGAAVLRHEVNEGLGKSFQDGLRLISTPITVRYFPERKSKVANNLAKYTQQTLRIILKAFRDYRPFYFFGLLASVPLVVGIALAIFLLYHYIFTGEFTPYKFVGFVGIYLFSLGLVFIIIGFLADILVGLQLTAEKQLYLQKKAMQKKGD